MTDIDNFMVARLDRLAAQAHKIALVTHIHPDGDAIGSSTALLHYLRSRGKEDVRIIVHDQMPQTITFLTEGLGIIFALDNPDAAAEWISSSDLIICLDMNGFDRAGSAGPMLAESKAAKVLIDHHLNPAREQFTLVFSETEISSASELLFWVLMGMPDINGDAHRLPSATATALMTGMTTDTNNFANSVFPSTLEMASRLLDAGVDRDDLIDRIYNSHRENRVRAISHLLGNVMVIRPEGYAYIILDKETFSGFRLHEGELEGMVNIPLSIKDVKLSIYLREDEGHFRVSIRSKRGISANRLAREHFNGGGHEQAAGGRLYFPADITGPDQAAAYIERYAPEVL